MRFLRRIIGLRRRKESDTVGEEMERECWVWGWSFFKYDKILLWEYGNNEASYEKLLRHRRRGTGMRLIPS